MKTTFLRIGHANNSSSSHSVIFVNDSLKNKIHDNYDDDFQFGWETFTLSSREAKARYCFMALLDFWGRYKGNNHYEREQFNKSFNALKSRVKRWMPVFNEWIDDWSIDEVYDGYIDHQSLFTFPTYRDPSKGLHKEFAKDWCYSIINKNFVVLGGNDNGGEHDLASSGDNGKIVFDQLVEVGELPMCEYDDTTHEYVISTNGRMLKVMREIVEERLLAETNNLFVD